MEHNPTIIVIDDEEAIVKFMLVALKKMGYSADFSTDSGNGLDLIKKNKYNIVLLDLFMPKESGLSLLMKIKKIDIKTQVIIITGYGSEFSLTACLKSGADDFICKPFELDDLREAVSHCVTKIKRWEKIETIEKIDADSKKKKASK